MQEYELCEPAPMSTKISTRKALFGSALASALALWAGASALAQVEINRRETQNGKVLVTIFLRGAMDGLSLIVPTGDDDYHKARPALRIAGALKLTDYFGLHPSAAALKPLFDDQRLAAIQAIGSLDQSRSHFEAMATMERGAASDPASISSGWVGRYLEALPSENQSPLRAVAFGSILPDILRGATTATVLRELSELQLSATPHLSSALRRLYQTEGSTTDAVLTAGRETLSVLDTIQKLDPKSYKPAGNATYPETALGQGLRQTALLVKARVGLEVACLDRPGWDTHVAQGTSVGYLALQFQDLADSLAAFAADLGPHLEHVTVAVMTEFGRRVAENSGLGTDHGRASAWLVLGGVVNGGKVHGVWPGCAPEKLEDPGDLKVTTDYRDALTTLAGWRLGSAAAKTLFPGAPNNGLPELLR
jgi:uncharacterized protein (DUF1501 family)